MLFENGKVVSARVNCSGLSDTFRMCSGSLFHCFGPNAENPHRPNLSVLERGMTTLPWSTEHSCSRFSSALTELEISCRYVGAETFRQLPTTIQILYVMCCRALCSESDMVIYLPTASVAQGMESSTCLHTCKKYGIL